jgi:hypothetical protein
MFGRSVRANADEKSRPLPCDDLIPQPLKSLTHAISIRRPRRDVWPWLAQMGAGRAGWYSYDFIDNGGQPSSERLLPQFLTVAPGDLFPAIPKETQGFLVLRCEPGRSLVLGWPLKEVTYMVTWAFFLDDMGENGTRLIVRARGSAGYRAFGMPLWLTRLLMPLGHFLMQRKQLLGIAQRAEAI